MFLSFVNEQMLMNVLKDLLDVTRMPTASTPTARMTANAEKDGKEMGGIVKNPVMMAMMVGCMTF